MINTDDYKPTGKIILNSKQKKHLKEFKKTAGEITKLMDDFKFYYAAEKIYHYFWRIFCDKIIEESKVPLALKGKEKTAAQYVLLKILSDSLKILHPFMPFITEEIYQQLPVKNKKKSLMVENWPN